MREKKKAKYLTALNPRKLQWRRSRQNTIKDKFRYKQKVKKIFWIFFPFEYYTKWTPNINVSSCGNSNQIDQYVYKFVHSYRVCTFKRSLHTQVPGWPQAPVCFLYFASISRLVIWPPDWKYYFSLHSTSGNKQKSWRKDSESRRKYSSVDWRGNESAER